MKLNNNEGIKTDIRLVGRKNKTDKTRYCIYIVFYIHQNGVQQFSPSISTGITITVKKWKRGLVLGNSEAAKELNEKLETYKSDARAMLDTLSLKNIRTCSELVNEINLNAKQIVTGKAPRGFKADFVSKLKSYSYSEVLSSYCEKKQLSLTRTKSYIRTISYLEQCFDKTVSFPINRP